MAATLEATAIAANRTEAADALFDALYSELHRLSRRELYRQGGLAGFGVTTLLHEAYLTMSGKDGPVFLDRPRFMAYATRVMRGLIIDDIRRRRSQKRGGLVDFTTLGTHHLERVNADSHTLLRISDALDELGAIDSDLAEVIDLKFFCGFSFAEIAAMRGVSERTIQRHWEKGRLYLHHAVGGHHAAFASPGSAARIQHAGPQR